MLHYHKFRQELLDPVPAREIYIKRPAGRGWPEECPPIRAGNAFGFDLLANFDLTFVQKRGKWSVMNDLVIESDFEYSRDKSSPGVPLAQQYAWFWQKGQTIPHVISDHVYKELTNQVKVSSFLYLKTDPGELLLMTGIPNTSHRKWRTMTAVVDTDWYPASYPWHIVLELDRDQKKIVINKGDPLCRVIPVQRDTYTARPMKAKEFSDFFDRGQQWLITHGRPHDDETMDITRTYVKQQKKAKFVVG